MAINIGSINVNAGGCFGPTSVSVIVPHITVDDKKLAAEVAKTHTDTL